MARDKKNDKSLKEEKLVSIDKKNKARTKDFSQKPHVSVSKKSDRFDHFKDLDFETNGFAKIISNYQHYDTIVSNGRIIRYKNIELPRELNISNSKDLIADLVGFYYQEDSGFYESHDFIIICINDSFVFEVVFEKETDDILFNIEVLLFNNDIIEQSDRVDIDKLFLDDEVLVTNIENKLTEKKLKPTSLNKPTKTKKNIQSSEFSEDNTFHIFEATEKSEIDKQNFIHKNFNKLSEEAQLELYRIAQDDLNKSITKKTAINNKKTNKVNRSAIRIDFRISEALLAQIDDEAKKQGIDRTSWIRTSFENYIRDFPDKCPPPFPTFKATKSAQAFLPHKLAKQLEEVVSKSGLSRSAWMKQVLYWTCNKTEADLKADPNLDR